jgi:hypothetical protein
MLENLTGIKAITKRILRKKAVNLDQYDQLRIECLNFCLKWNQLIRTLQKNNLPKLQTKERNNDLENSAIRLIDFANDGETPKNQEYYHVIEINKAVRYLEIQLKNTLTDEEK